MVALFPRITLETSLSVHRARDNDDTTIAGLNEKLDRIFGLGLVNKDVVAVVPSWNRDEKAEATHLFEQVGGPVPVALATMARMGTDTRPMLLGVLGDDRHADDLQDWLKTSGVEAGHLRRAPGMATSVSVVVIDARDGSRTVANHAAALPPLLLTAAEEALLSRARLLHIDGRDLPAALAAARIVRAAGGLVSFDLGSMRPGRAALFPFCDILIASRRGGSGAFPDIADDPFEQTRRFLAAGVRRVVGVTLGNGGVVIGEPGREPVLLPAPPVAAVIDTNGAGDVFHGAFLRAWIVGLDAAGAATFAQTAAARSIERMGNGIGPDGTGVEVQRQG